MKYLLGLCSSTLLKIFTFNGLVALIFSINLGCSKGYYLKEPARPANNAGEPQSKPTTNTKFQIPNYCPPIKVTEDTKNTAIPLSGGIAVFPERSIIPCDFVAINPEGKSQNYKVLGTKLVHWVPPMKLVAVQAPEETSTHQVNLQFELVQNNDELAEKILSQLSRNTNLLADRRMLNLLSYRYSEIQLPIDLALHWNNQFLSVYGLFENDKKVNASVTLSSAEEKKSFMDDLSVKGKITIYKYIRMNSEIQTFATDLFTNSTGHWRPAQPTSNAEMETGKLAQYLSENLELNRKGYTILDIQKHYPEVTKLAQTKWQNLPKPEDINTLDEYLLPIAAALQIKSAQTTYELYLKLKPLVLGQQGQTYLKVALSVANGSLSLDSFNKTLPIAIDLSSNESIRYFSYLTSNLTYTYWDAANQIIDFSRKNNANIDDVGSVVKTLYRVRLHLHFDGPSLKIDHFFLSKSYTPSWNPALIDRIEKIFIKIYPEYILKTFSSPEEFWTALKPILLEPNISDDELVVFSRAYSWFLLGQTEPYQQPRNISSKKAVKKALEYRKIFKKDSLQKLIALFGQLYQYVEVQKIAGTDTLDYLENYLIYLETFIIKNPDVKANEIDLISIVTGWLTQKEWVKTFEDNQTETIPGSQSKILPAFNKATYLVMTKKLDATQFKTFQSWVYMLVQKGKTPSEAVQLAMTGLSAQADSSGSNEISANFLKEKK